jgi:hypothetical protein
MTLVLPAANGAATRAAFWHHAAWVLAGCAAIVAIAAAYGTLTGGDRR